MSQQFIYELNKLLQDEQFLKLKSLRSKSNLFEMLAASHTEMWHSAFIKWLLDPKSSLNLGTYPLKRFLYTVVYENFSEIECSLTFAQIESDKALQLHTMQFETEKSFRTETVAGRFDIIATNDVLRLTIENKVKAREGADQTTNYFNFLQQDTEKYQYDLKVFLSPNGANGPACDSFLHIDYQAVCDFVIKACLVHPHLSDENRYILQEYLTNLGKPLRGGQVMALPNKELCEQIYASYKDVLDEIFLSVKGVTPESTTRTRSAVELSHLLHHGYILPTDRLRACRFGLTDIATISQENGQVIIQLNGDTHTSLSSAAKAIAPRKTNGWNFWEVIDEGGNSKGVLIDLREQLTDELEGE